LAEQLGIVKGQNDAVVTYGDWDDNKSLPFTVMLTPQFNPATKAVVIFTLRQAGNYNIHKPFY
jgi:hypothetical protein